MNELKITPLGTVSPYCKGSKNCPGILIEYGDFKALFDCGNGITRNMNMMEQLKGLKVFLSHLHVDHYGDLLSLAQAALVYKRLGFLEEDIDIYIPKSDPIKVSDYLDSWGNTQFVEKNSIDYEFIHALGEKHPINILDYQNLNFKQGDIKISSLKVPHPISSFAFRMDTPCGSVVYSSDTGPKNDLRNFAKDADLFICESTYLRGQTRDNDDHLFAHEAAAIAKDANVKELLLTHFWPEIEKDKYVEEAKEVFENTQAAIEGKQYVLRRGHNE